MNATRKLIKAIDRVLDTIQDRQTCPICPANFAVAHKRGCVIVALLRAREDFARSEAVE